MRPPSKPEPNRVGFSMHDIKGALAYFPTTVNILYFILQARVKFYKTRQ